MSTEEKVFLVYSNLCLETVKFWGKNKTKLTDHDFEMLETIFTQNIGIANLAVKVFNESL